nr:helix-turn-helix domain-containing protein [Streptomyces sp. CC224E]
MGTTPLAWLLAERVALACRIIERGEQRIDVVAARSGLGSAANLRARLKRATGLSPSAYRKRFGDRAPAG